MTFRALMLNEQDRVVTAEVQTVEDGELPQGNVTVAVEYSTLNYKDGMILGGIGRLVRNYPHVGGIDFAGVVESSDDSRFSAGDRVVLTGWRVGETHWGGYAERARVDADWLVRLPESMSTFDAMALGTAGFTSMLAVQALENHGIGAGPVLATGAAGGVGSVAVHLLSAAGHAVAASTGRPQTADYLRSLGASEIIDRAELAEPPQRTVRRLRGCGGRHHTGQRADADVLRLQRGGVRPGRGQRAGHNGDPVLAARREPARHRLGHVPVRTAPVGMAALGRAR